MNENNANFTPAAPNFKTLVRMSFQGLTNFPYIEEDFDALTDYELLSKVVEYLNQVISNNNEQNTLMTNLYNAYVSLQNYVNNYFDNLDVQEEINNKLESMAQSGELTELIRNYVDPIYQSFENEVNNKLDEQDEEISSFKTNVNSRVNEIDIKVDQATSGSPLVASSTSEMTETDRIYVNTTDGNWYYYDGDSWEIGGVYQSTGISSSDPIIVNIDNQLEQIRTKVESKQLFNSKDVTKNKNLESTFNVSTPEDLTDSTGINVSNIIYFDEPLTTTVDFSTNIIGFSKILTYKSNGTDLVREGNFGNSSLVNDTPPTNNRKLSITATANAPIYAIRFSYNAASNPNLDTLYFCKTSDFEWPFDTVYKNYYKLNDKLDVSHLIAENPIYYNGNEVNTFYKGIAIGDSLTEGTFNIDGGYVVHKQYAYPMYFYKKTGVTIRNFGVGGSTAGSWYTRYQNVTFPVYDFAIIAFGVNEMSQGVSAETMITNINNIVTKLKSQNADCKCFIATINVAYDSYYGEAYETMNEAIRDYASSTANCYLLDIAEYGLTKVGTAFVNGHLTALGYEELANEYANMISYIIKNNPTEFANLQFSGTEYSYLPSD